VRQRGHLDDFKAFDDNADDIFKVGLDNWKTFQNSVYKQLRIFNPFKKIGSQITLDVFYTKNGVANKLTIIPDNLIQNGSQGSYTYKVIDAKTSRTNELVTKPDLTSTCTANQKPVYKMIDGGGTYTEDGITYTITKVEMRGGQAEASFKSTDLRFNNGKEIINIEPGVEFWVNASVTDFTRYHVRPRKIN
jgi:hypothetical protein